MKKDYSRYAYILIWAIMVITSMNHHLSLDSLRVITWDVYGYYLYLPALFKYGDTTQYTFTIEHLAKYSVSGQIYQIIEWNDSKAPIYTIGMAMIYLPFYLVADILAHIIPSVKADGLSPIYQWSIVLASWVYSLMGLYFSDKILRSLKVSGATIVLTLSIIYLGTNLFHYAVFENGMPHHYLYAFYTILIYCTISWHKEAKLKYAVAGAVSIAMLCLARPSEIIAILIPGCYGIYNGLSWLIKVNRLKKYARQILIMMIIGTLLVAIQVAFWKININEWVFNGYQGHHFDFLSPHIFDGIFSFRKGWLIYSPLCILGIAGLPLMWKYDKRFVLPVLSFAIINIYIVLSWHIWWYASSFGMRALIQSYAVLMVPMAFFIEWMTLKRGKRYLIISIALTGISLNQFQDWQYRNKILLQDEMNYTYYRKSFLRTQPDKKLRKYIDAPEAFNGKGKLVVLREYQSIKGDTILPGRFGYTHRINIKDLGKEMKDRWINVEATVSMEGNKYNSHRQARLVVAQKRQDDNLKWRGVRFQQMIEDRNPLNIDFDFKLNQPQSDDEYIEVTIWNNGPDVVFLQALNIYQYK